MHIYFSGIGGSGLMSLAQICLDLGCEVSGSDREESTNLQILRNLGIQIFLGQNGQGLVQANMVSKVDWYIFSPAVKSGNPEFDKARELGLKMTKQNALINFILEEKHLKLIAVAGTHGKTTTTSMIVWLFKQLNIPVSWFIGTTPSFGSGGKYEVNSQYFVMEADEYDRKLLDLQPEISVITSLDFDHPDTYKSQEDYNQTFVQFISQTKSQVFLWEEVWERLSPRDKEIPRQLFELPPLLKKGNLSTGFDYKVQESNFATISDRVNKFSSSEEYPRSGGGVLNSPTIHSLSRDSKLENLSVGDVKLFGQKNRENAFLALNVVWSVAGNAKELNVNKLNDFIGSFPGTERRMQKIQENLYSDYAHHPSEISAVINLAREMMTKNELQTGSKVKPKSKLVIVYQSHQNARQYAIKDDYATCFAGSDKVYWLPTYLSRENPDQAVLTPQELTKNISNTLVKISEFNEELKLSIDEHLKNGDFVMFLGAGSINSWLVENWA